MRREASNSLYEFALHERSLGGPKLAPAGMSAPAGLKVAIVCLGLNMLIMMVVLVVGCFVSGPREALYGCVLPLTLLGCMTHGLLRRRPYARVISLVLATIVASFLSCAYLFALNVWGRPGPYQLSTEQLLIAWVFAIPIGSWWLIVGGLAWPATRAYFRSRREPLPLLLRELPGAR